MSLLQPFCIRSVFLSWLCHDVSVNFEAGRLQNWVKVFSACWRCRHGNGAAICMKCGATCIMNGTTCMMSGKHVCTTDGVRVRCASCMHCYAQHSILAELVEVINNQECAQVRRHTVEPTAVHNSGVALLGSVVMFVCYAPGPQNLT